MLPFHSLSYASSDAPDEDVDLLKSSVFGTQKMASDASFWFYVVAAGLLAMILALLATRFLNAGEAEAEKMLMQGRPSELSVHSVEEIVTDLPSSGAGETTSPLLESATLLEEGATTTGQTAGEVSVVLQEDDEEEMVVPMEI